MVEDIFSGEVMGSPAFPKKGFLNAWDKRDWGIKVLEEYVRKIHGRTISAYDNGNRQGRLTGIKAFVQLGEKLITYALIEPKKKQDQVLIVRTESHVDELSTVECLPSENDSVNTLASAFTKAKIDPDQLRQELPSKDELMVVEINHNRKTNSLGIAPQYLDEDPLLSGQKSMRVFYPVSVNGELQIGQKWRCRQTKKPVVAGANKHGVPMIHINVELMRAMAA